MTVPVTAEAVAAAGAAGTGPPHCPWCSLTPRPAVAVALALNEDETLPFESGGRLPQTWTASNTPMYKFIYERRDREVERTATVRRVARPFAAFISRAWSGGRSRSDLVRSPGFCRSEERTAAPVAKKNGTAVPLSLRCVGGGSNRSVDVA